MYPRPRGNGTFVVELKSSPVKAVRHIFIQHPQWERNKNSKPGTTQTLTRRQLLTGAHLAHEIISNPVEGFDRTVLFCDGPTCARRFRAS